jgi:toxin secretion/phage lysis holin
MKVINVISITGGVIGGFLANYLGGYDMILTILINVVVLDIISGIIKSLYSKTLSSKVSWKGMLKKVAIFIIIALACQIEKYVGQDTGIREIVIVFYIVNEAISILENFAEFIKLPQKLKDVLLTLKTPSVGDKNENN